MYAQIEKSKENKSRAVANSVAQKKSNGMSGVGFVDNRPKLAQMKRLQELANNSPQNRQLVQRQKMANEHAGKKKQPIQKKENNTGLPDNLKAGIENFSGYSADDVKVHYNSDKPAQLNAHAYAQGTDIHIASGQEKHLPHEAWHVVQQKQGRVEPTIQIKDGVSVNNDLNLEKEADEMGRNSFQFVGDRLKVAQMKRLREVANNCPQTQQLSQPKKTSNDIVQRIPWSLAIAGAGATLGLIYAAAKWWKGNSKKKNDTFRPLVTTVDPQQLKEDVDTAMINIKERLLNNGHPSMNTTGRDRFIYSPYGWLTRKNNAQILETWSPAWDVKDTAGLLLDLGSAVKGVPELSEFRGREDEMSGDKVVSHGTLSIEHRRVRENNNVPGPEWGLDGSRWDFQAGPSATTSNLLKLLRTLGCVTHKEIEAIMEAVIMFWEGHTKRTTGDYHTAAEVWMAYSQHLEIVRPDWTMPGDLNNSQLMTLEQQINS